MEQTGSPRGCLTEPRRPGEDLICTMRSLQAFGLCVNTNWDIFSYDFIKPNMEVIRSQAPNALEKSFSVEPENVTVALQQMRLSPSVLATLKVQQAHKQSRIILHASPRQL